MYDAGEVYAALESIRNDLPGRGASTLFQIEADRILKATAICIEQLKSQNNLLKWDSEAAKINFQLWQEAAARIAELENELHLAHSIGVSDIEQGPCPGGCHRQTQGARYCLSCFCTNERKLRIAYQDIVYRICNIVDKALGQHATKGNGVTIDTVAPALESLLVKRSDNDLRGMVRDAVDEKYCTCNDGTCDECQREESTHNP